MTQADPVVLNDRYELRGLLGRGGMAEVHLGFDRLLHRQVAVKLMHPHLAGAVDRRRFAAETRVLANLNDPHLVTLLDAGVETGGLSRPWLVMELVTGPTLAQRLAGGPLPREEVAALGAGLARALVEVHRQGVVHRDVKPANVLVTAAGEAKLADFGVARMMGETSDLTVAGHTVGTAAYLAPEQISGRSVTGASDVYALGLVLLEALTGRRAYPGSATEAAFARLHHGPLIPVSLGAAWTQLLEAMTASEPEQRVSALEAHQRLTRLADSRTDPVVPPSEVTGAWPVTLSEAAPALVDETAGADGVLGRRLLVAAGLAVVLLLGGVAYIDHGASGGDAARAAAGSATPASSGSASPSASSTRTHTATPQPSAAPVVVTTPATTSPPHSRSSHRPQHRSQHRPQHRAPHHRRPARHHAPRPHGPPGKHGHGHGHPHGPHR